MYLYKVMYPSPSQQKHAKFAFLIFCTLKRLTTNQQKVLQEIKNGTVIYLYYRREREINVVLRIRFFRMQFLGRF